MARLQLHPVPHVIPHELSLLWVEFAPETSYRLRRELCREALLGALSSELGRPVADSEIIVGTTGKPRLGSGEIAFNLSHSGHEALIGIGTVGEIGVDVETVRPIPEADALVAEYCGPSEREIWLRTAPVQRERWLLQCWTRKEACLKSIGAGLFHPPATVEVGPGPEPAVARIGFGAAVREVEVFSPVLPSGSPAAVAVLDGRND